MKYPTRQQPKEQRTTRNTRRSDYAETGAERTNAPRGRLADQLLAEFPPRPLTQPGPSTRYPIEKVIERIDAAPFRATSPTSRASRRRGTVFLLQWLEAFPGTWQERWQASGAEEMGLAWPAAAEEWHRAHGPAEVPQVFEKYIRAGLWIMSITRAIQPSITFFLKLGRVRHYYEAAETYWDPEGFERLRNSVEPPVFGSESGCLARWQITLLLLAKGGGVGDITIGDCIELRQIEMAENMPTARRYLFYRMLYFAGVFAPGAPATLRGITSVGGQQTVEKLVDRYDLANREVRDVLVDYLAERQPALDYNTLEDLARTLACKFWKDLETHHPGIDTLQLEPAVARAWKERLKTKTTFKRQPDGTVLEIASPRVNYGSLLTAVRGFYLDIAQWAAEDPARWARWAAPSPIKRSELAFKKHDSRRKSRMDQRTRTRLPLVPLLVQTAERRARDAQTRLEAALAAEAGQPFTVLGETFHPKTNTIKRVKLHRRTIVVDSTGRARNLRTDENRAFWAWAAVEFLRHTGVRIEEMLETSHHSITQYQVPETGEVIPLLHIAPSKTDVERLLVINPELADVLSTIIARIRQPDGMVPLVPFYDNAEKIWVAPSPLLFQRVYGGIEASAISDSTIRAAIKEILQDTDLLDADGQPLYFVPHDLRRIFTTEAILNGMPPHIAQMLLGHKDINTTMGYKAVYPEEAINGHRAFIARRRRMRPSEEYRIPTDAEWDEFLGHFERRKVALGECGRAYGTSCQHEHSCIRCPVLRTDPTQRVRLEQIRDNLSDRITEAEREGWLGEAEGLRVSLAAATDKLAQLDNRARQAATVFLDTPAFPEVVSSTLTAGMPPAPARNGGPA